MSAPSLGPSVPGVNQPPAVTDRMKYGVKKLAVATDNLLHNIKGVNGRVFNFRQGETIEYEIPGLGPGHYADFSTSYFRLKLQFTIKNDVAARHNYGMLRFERGPESMFKRVQFQDIAGNLLESFENYNELYALTELLTSNKKIRNGVNNTHYEGLHLSRYANAGNAFSAQNTYHILQTRADPPIDMALPGAGDAYKSRHPNTE
mmetsp:Transcript_9417/g.12378  ORF Transcript_9417/g.12378 Transcript_9417/m.12378 type:complete len:204 (-) Transcript_9417:25-636(-)